MTFKILSLVFVAFSLAFCGNYVSTKQQDESSSLQTKSVEADATAQEKVPVDSANPSEKYDAELAKQLGADEYGMKSYVFVLLKTGKVTVEDQEKSKQIFAGHFANMSRLAKEGKLVLAGPFVEGEPKRGLFVLNVASIQEAEELVKTDPAVEAGVFDYELTKLYCSAALMKINEIHETVQKTKTE